MNVKNSLEEQRVGGCKVGKGRGRGGKGGRSERGDSRFGGGRVWTKWIGWDGDREHGG